MENKKLYFRFGIIVLMIVLAAFSRIISHPANFAPIGAISLFGAAYFYKKIYAFIIPILSMWISDLFINNVVYGKFFDKFVWFYDGCYFTYSAFIFIVLIGIPILRKVKIQNIVLGSLLASIIFFLVSNFGVWFSTNMYPANISGLIACYLAGIPFFKNTIAGDLVYCSVLFGVFEFMQYKIPTLKIQTKKTA